MRAMPTAPPISRTVSLSAEATPCFSSGSDEVIAAVNGLMARPTTGGPGGARRARMPRPQGIPAASAGEGDGRGPPSLGPVLERQHESADRNDRQERACDVEAGSGVFDRVGDDHGGEREGEGGQSYGNPSGRPSQD